MELTTGDLSEHLERLEYPIGRADAAAECADDTVLFADGDADLGDLISGATRDRFESAEELLVDVQNQLPRNAVGEPFQSEGEG